MDNFNLPGFPPADMQDIVKFYVFKKLAYSKRLILILLFIFIGLGLQISFLNFLPGLPFLLLAVVFNLVKGYDVRLDTKGYRSDGQWTKVGMDRIEAIEGMQKKTKLWDRDALDVSNSLGCFTLVGALAGISLVTRFLTSLFGMGELFFFDALVLIVPIWFNGIKRMGNGNRVEVKSKILLELGNLFYSLNIADAKFQPALLLAKNKAGKAVPIDLKFAVEFKDMPQGFYGLQGQININVVDGKIYPYFYCVIPAQKGFGLKPHYLSLSKSFGGNNDKIIVEYQEKDAEVIVIRQVTTKTSGYHTNMKACAQILSFSLGAVKNILETNNLQTDN